MVEIPADAKEICTAVLERHTNPSRIRSDVEKRHTDALEKHSDGLERPANALERHSDVLEMRSDAIEMTSDALIRRFYPIGMNILSVGWLILSLFASC